MAYYATEGRKISDLPELKEIKDTDKLVIGNSEVNKFIDVGTMKTLMNGIELIVTIPEESTVSISDDDITITKVVPVGESSVRFDVPYYGTWLITATKDEDSVMKSISIAESRQYTVALRYHHIYTIKRDTNSSSPEWTRDDDAVGMTATASVGTTAGESDFDLCYPWRDMKRVVLSTQTNGIQTMVWIPEFWYSREVDSDGIETIQICDKNMTGFAKHPGSGCYVGAYKFGNGGKSITGVTVKDSLNISGFKSQSATNGDGWVISNIAIWSAIQMLFLVEFATNNSQAAIGLGMMHNYQITGSCDNVPNLTGRPAGTDGSVDIVYRGIEGLWGNYTEFIDGVNVYNNSYYVCTDPTKFASDTATNYDTVSYTAPSGSIVYITKVGYDPNLPWVMLPSVASGGSSTTYYCDKTYITSGWKTLMVGGWYGYEDACGLFFCYGHKASNQSDTGFSSRVAYYPELDTNHDTTIYEGIGGES